MTPPVPVPSKAAIHALRGLALGSSCAIGLIVEDRRRRISTLRTAVDNQKKIKTSRHYHGSTEAARHATDDAVVLSGDELHWHYRDGPLSGPEQDASRATARLLPPSKSETGARTRDTEDRIAPAKHHAERPVPEGEAQVRRKPLENAGSRINALRPSADLSRSKDSGGWASAAKMPVMSTPDEKIAEILDLSVSSIKAKLEEPGALATYKAAFMAAMQRRRAFKKKLDHRWLNVSEALCTSCQEHDLWRDAHEILSDIVRSGELDEGRYYAHAPFAVIDSLLSNLEADGDAIVGKLHLASRLFLANFEDKPALHVDDVKNRGQDLISLLLRYKQMTQVHDVFWRVLKQLERTGDFTAWFIKNLHQHGDHKSVIKYFRLNFSKAATDTATFESTFNRVLTAVETLRGARAEPVARALAQQCNTAGLRPRAGWLIKLLQCHWDRHHDLQMSRDFFAEPLFQDLLSKLVNPEAVYQIMVKISVLAGNKEAALHYREETIRLAPGMQNNVWLNGYTTLMKAKNGLWDEVHDDFTEMKLYAQSQSEAYNQTFVAILKVFTESHTVAQTEEFIKLYVEEMDVRLHRYAVTLVANKYGALHDDLGFLAWLRYCRSQGLALDAAYTNAILRNLRLEWKLPFEVLVKLYKSIRHLDPVMVDDVTIRIMHSSAMEEGNYSGRDLSRRLRILGPLPSNLPHKFRSANERDVLHAMTEVVLRGKPVRAVVMYKRALTFGMPWCPKCFRVAVKASLQRAGDNFGRTTKLISETHAEGHDITDAASMLIKAQITQFRGPFEEVMRNLRALITRFEALGLTIESSVLTHAAVMATQCHQHSRAVDFCMLAMEQSGATNPCFSRQNLRALLSAYWQTLNIDGLRWLVDSLPSSPLAADKKAFGLLKSAKRHMKQWEQSARVEEMMGILQTGINHARQERARKVKFGAMMAKETLRIMSDAAEDLDMARAEDNYRRRESNRASDMEKTLVPGMRARSSVEAYG